MTVLDLPASGWSGGTSARQDYKFKSRSGAVISARLVAGHSIRLSARGDGAYPLGGTAQGGVGIIIDGGGVRFCGFFGGTIVKDDGERFRARKAPAPASCPILGTTTTTSTTTSTTSTTSTSTSTTLGTADLSLTKVASPTTIFSASPMSVTFTVTLHNAGPATATGVEVMDLPPAAFTYDSSTARPGSYDSTTGVWSVGTLASGNDGTLQLMTHATCTDHRGTTQQNTAKVTAADQTDPTPADE